MNLEREFYIMRKIAEKYFSADMNRFGAEYDAARKQDEIDAALKRGSEQPAAPVTGQ